MYHLENDDNEVEEATLDNVVCCKDPPATKAKAVTFRNMGDIILLVFRLST